MINSTTLTNLTTSTNFRHSSLHLTVSTNSPLQYHSLFIIFPFVLNPRSIRRTLNPKLKDRYHCWRLEGEYFGFLVYVNMIFCWWKSVYIFFLMINLDVYIFVDDYIFVWLVAKLMCLVLNRSFW
jgi:hypothetical protein